MLATDSHFFLKKYFKSQIKQTPGLDLACGWRVGKVWWVQSPWSLTKCWKQFSLVAPRLPLPAAVWAGSACPQR